LFGLTGSVRVRVSVSGAIRNDGLSECRPEIDHTADPIRFIHSFLCGHQLACFIDSPLTIEGILKVNVANDNIVLGRSLSSSRIGGMRDSVSIV